MPRGFKSVHPLTQQVLEQLGVTDDDVTQGWGDAPASAGYHAAEGFYAGRRFSSCVDLSWRSDFCNPDWRSRAVAAGLCPFYRDWTGNQHIHCVHVGLRDTKGRVTILDGPRMQIVDFTRGLDGLVGHNKLTGPLAPTADERAFIRDKYAAWAPSYATAVYVQGKRLRCYAWLTADAVTVEVRPVLEAMGFTILDVTGVEGLLLRDPSGERFRIAGGMYRAGEFMRCPVRELVTMISAQRRYAVDFQQLPGEDGVPSFRVDVSAQ